MLSVLRSASLRRHVLSSGLRALSSTTQSPTTIPWFVDTQRPEPVAVPSPSLRQSKAPPMPTDTPEILKEIHSALLKSPHLDLQQLLVSPAVAPPPGPELPERPAQGKRRRGGTYAGESAYDATSGLWDWFIFAQVKEGTEGRGAIDSVVRSVRKVLLTRTPPVTLPPKSRRQMQNGWAMIDAGHFAVHVLSKEAREKYFSDAVRH